MERIFKSIIIVEMAMGIMGLVVNNYGFGYETVITMFGVSIVFGLLVAKIN